MKIAVVNNCVPFLRGGAEYLADAIVEKLTEFGHEAVLIKIPFSWEPPERIAESMLACRLIRIANIDRVVALKFPAYFVPHPNKILWLLHQFRQAYDLWGTEHQYLANSDAGLAVRSTIMNADNRYLPEARHIYTNSQVTSDRLKTFNGLQSEVLYPPLLDSTAFTCAGYGDYIFAGGRVNASKRQALLVESMRHCNSGVKLVVAGKAEAGEATVIKALVEKYGLQDRVTFVDRYVTEAEKVDWIGGALACAYIPLDEDSYGYVTLEAYTARKAVVTCSDSGGIRILVKDDDTGLVANPDIIDIARCFDEFYDNHQKARAFGERGYELVQRLNITWENVVQRLTA